MEKIAAYEEIKDFIQKSKKFINTLDLSEEQYDSFKMMIESLIKMVAAGDAYGISAYNTPRKTRGEKLYEI